MRLIPCGLLIACAAATAAAMAGPRDEVLERARQCGSLADDAAWLECYRAAAAPMAAAMAAPMASRDASAPAFAPVASDSNPLTAPALSLRPARAAAASDHITAHLVSYSFTSQKYFVLVLDNGQVWQQINGDDEFAVLRQPASQYEVTIKHGLFGSYNLTISGFAGLYRVRRVS
jgi:hypothetical protein